MGNGKCTTRDSTPLSLYDHDSETTSATDIEVGEMSDFKLGDELREETDGVVPMPPPVVFRVQPNSYVQLNAPAQLREWEQAVRLTTGLEIVADNLAGSACETGCSYGSASHSDDCGLV
jgi:hypothetical protein